MLHLTLSPHALDRAKERAGWSRRTLERMLVHVVYDGLAADECAGALRHYLSGLPDGGPTRFVRVYGEHVFVFAREASPNAANLVTVLHLPLPLRAAARRARAQRDPLAA